MNMDNCIPPQTLEPVAHDTLMPITRDEIRVIALALLDRPDIFKLFPDEVVSLALKCADIVENQRAMDKALISATLN